MAQIIRRLEKWEARQRLTLDLAEEFLGRCRSRKVGFTPMAVAQGWSPASYASAVSALQAIGYTRIAVGGMVPLKTHEILACLQEIDTVRAPADPVSSPGNHAVQQHGGFRLASA